MSLERRGEAPYREVYVDPSRDPASARRPLLPEIEMLGHDRFPTAKRLGLPVHRHAAAFEICYVVDGQLYWHLRDETYSLRRGDIFVTPPNEPHGGEDAVMQPGEIYWLQVRIPSSDQSLPGMTQEQTDEVYRGLCATSSTPAFPSTATACLESAFASLMREHRESPINGPLSTVASRAALQTLLVQIVRDASKSAAERSHLSHPLAKALCWMEAHLDEPFTVDAAAAVASLSVAAFHDRFQREVGAAPAEWRTRKRIERAKTWLVQDPDKSVTEIALMLGFGSSQYFATAFKRYTAHTPTEYRQHHQGRPTKLS